jgi:hypothetical protein
MSGLSPGVFDKPRGSWFTGRVRRFSVWLIIGFVLALVNTMLFNGAFAQTGPDLDKFDPDLYPAIDVGHSAPVLVRSDEKVQLEFTFACGFALPSGERCHPEATLFVARGRSGEFAPVALTEQNRDSLRVLTAELPASDANGPGLRYYLEVREDQVGVRLRYPSAGVLEPTVRSAFTPMGLSAGQQMSPELVLRVPWGDGSEAVGLDQKPNKATLSVDAFDVAPNGTLALLDHVNTRVMLIDPRNHTFRSVAVLLKGVGDVEIDGQGQVTVLDLVGERSQNSKVKTPQLHRLGANGQLMASAPVFALRPTQLTEDATVLDMTDQREITPLNLAGQARSRDEQHQSRTQASLLVQFLTGSQARLADTKRGLAFELRADHDLGAIPYFARTGQSYVVAFESENLRLVWFDAQGHVLKDVVVPNRQSSVFNPTGRIGIDKTGAVYILGSTPEALEIHRVQGPREVTQ